MRESVRLLTHSRFGFFWLARLLSLVGTHTSRTAMLLLLATRPDAVVNVGWLIWCELLPGALAGFGASGIVDRWPRRRVLILADFARALTLVAAAWNPEPWVLFTATALNSVASAFFNPSRAAALPSIVGKSDLTAANALDQSVSTAVLIAGPLLGAQIFLRAGIQWALLLDALTFLLSALFVLAALPHETEPTTETSSLWTEVGEGWRYVRERPLMRALLMLSAVSILSVGMWTPLASQFVQTFLGATEVELAHQLSIFGLGGLIGAPLAAWTSRHAGRGSIFTAMLLAEALAMLAYSRTPHVLYSGCIILVWGMVVSGLTVPFYSLLQDRVPTRQLGRVFAIHEQIESVGGAVAIAGPLALAKLLAPQDIFAVGGLLYATSVTLILFSRGGAQLMRAK